MKPLMLIPPAQAEALYDAQEEAPSGDRLAPLPWLDDEASEDAPRSKAPAEQGQQTRRLNFLLRAA